MSRNRTFLAAFGGTLCGVSILMHKNASEPVPLLSSDDSIAILKFFHSSHPHENADGAASLPRHKRPRLPRIVTLPKTPDAGRRKWWWTDSFSGPVHRRNRSRCLQRSLSCTTKPAPTKALSRPSRGPLTVKLPAGAAGETGLDRVAGIAVLVLPGGAQLGLDHHVTQTPIVGGLDPEGRGEGVHVVIVDIERERASRAR